MLVVFSFVGRHNLYFGFNEKSLVGREVSHNFRIHSFTRSGENTLFRRTELSLLCHFMSTLGKIEYEYTNLRPKLAM